jgi:hypothetical protein
MTLRSMLGAVDNDAVTNELRRFISLTELWMPPNPQGSRVRRLRTTRGSEDEVTRAAQVLDMILARVLPDWQSVAPIDPYYRWNQRRAAALRALEQLERQHDIEAMLGDTAPLMSANDLHRWIWEGARSLWQSGHFREAVRSASVKLNAETQNKLGSRNLAETGLFQSAFNDEEPKPGTARLRLPEDDGGKTAIAVRRGIRMFAEGCYAAIRNPTSHDELGEMPEQEALEQLACFSVLARWVDRAILQVV